MRIILFGATQFSKELLLFLLNIEKNNLIRNLEIKAVFSIPENFAISYSDKKVRNYNFANLKETARKHNIKYYEIDSARKCIAYYYNTIKEIGPDIIFVAGWYHMIPKKIREIARYGAWGIHASLLPKYAGGAPLVWAIINGEKETGVTLFRLDDGVDDGDIIAQESFTINDKDTIKEVYKKAIKYSKKILNNVLSNIEEINFIPQDKSNVKVYPQRCPEDGKIDWNRPANEIVNFIRAQTKPYPGAYSYMENKRVIVWEAKIERNNSTLRTTPGEILKRNEKYFLAATKTDLLKITEYDEVNNAVSKGEKKYCN